MNNDIIIGYILLALKNLKYNEEKMTEILDELRYLFDTVHESEAAEFYNSRKWQDED